MDIYWTFIGVSEIWLIHVTILIKVYDTLRENCPITEFILVRIFLYSDWIWRQNKLTKIKKSNRVTDLRIVHLKTLVCTFWLNNMMHRTYWTQNFKFGIKDFFSIFLWIWLRLLKKSLMENFILMCNDCSKTK